MPMPVPATPLPALLVESFSHRWQEFENRCRENGLDVMRLAEFVDVPRLWSCSEFIAQNCLRYPNLMFDYLQSGDLDRDLALPDYAQRLAQRLDSITDDDLFNTELRVLRQREMVRIAWRDIGEKAGVDVILLELSSFAIACIDYCAKRAFNATAETFGKPCDAQGKPVELIVLGMGKLGANELNFSSDVDLIFTYRDDGETVGGERTTSNYEFFVKQVQKLVSWLNETTADGFVFRVDTRLRPFGSSGQMALSFDAMESYYETHGRDWERYALVKANVISGNSDDGAMLMKRLRPFIYRRYLDFNAFEALREMKRMIMSEVKRKGMEENVKLGLGGIREIEFVGQAFQLIRGGQEKSLQERRILVVLDTLEKLNLLPQFAVEKLKAAYRYLRRTENRIQAIADQQTHLLPKSAIDQARLALAMGEPSWTMFLAKLDGHRNFVQEQFDQVFAAPQAQAIKQGADDKQDERLAIWLGRVAEEESLAILSRLGFHDGAAAYRLVRALADSSACRSLSPRGRERIDRVMPMLLGAVARNEKADACLPRVLNLIEAIAKRTVYLALLVEHPMAMSQLVHLCARSAWIADQLTRFPILLDELLDPRKLYEPMNKTHLALELENRLSVVEAGDVEALMNVLRQFKLANTLRVAASQLTNAMPLAKVSDHLTFIAEVLLQKVIDVVWQELVQRHGAPCFVVDGKTIEAGFATVAYGKLAGWELGFGSDLDLVFLHDSRGEQQMTNGDKAIDNAVFFARLGQRIIHFLNTQTTSGVLYDVDTRLRPSGKSGMLVSSLDSFAEYQKNTAWIWEHQALVRSRAVAGSEAIGEAFSRIRNQVLTKARDAAKLAQDVTDMRQRMRSELDKSNAKSFDLKQGLGGIIDVEFINQYLVLRWAGEYPELGVWADNLRIIEAAAKTKRLSEEDAKILAQAFLAYRHRVHELALDLQSAPLVGQDEFHDHRQAVIRIWQSVFPENAAGG